MTLKHTPGWFCFALLAGEEAEDTCSKKPAGRASPALKAYGAPFFTGNGLHIYAKCLPRTSPPSAAQKSGLQEKMSKALLTL